MSMVFSVFTDSAINSDSQFYSIFVTSKRNSVPSSYLSNLPSLSQSCAATKLLSVCIDFPVLDITYEWNDMCSFVTGLFHSA